jgi:hypothetical protein
MKKSYPLGVGSLGLFVGCQLLAQSSFAALGFVSDRASITPNQTIDWSDVGVEYDVLSAPFSGTTSAGLSYTVSRPGPANTFSLLDQSSGWLGNFAPGETVLTTDFWPGPLSIKFSDPIQGIAFQIQSDLYDDFTGSIEAFDTFGNSLGLFAFAGVSNDNADDSALTLGLLSDLMDISSITVDLASGQLDTFAINHVSILGAPPAVPEASTWASAGLLGGIVALWLRRQRSLRSVES